MHDEWLRGEIPVESLATMSQAEIDQKLPYMRKLLALCQKHGVDRWSEGWTIQDALPVLQKFFGLKSADELIPAN